MEKRLTFLFISILFLSFSALSQESVKTNSTQVVNSQYQETFPDFPGGMNELMKFINKNKIYENKKDKNNGIGTVRLKFTIEKDGSIGDSIIVTHSVSEYYDKEAIRIVKILPKWIPGSQLGKPVRISFSLPIKF
jgi:periplasmic protein TonB